MSLVNVETGEIVPRPGMDLVPDGWCDEVVVPWLEHNFDQSELEMMAAQLDGLIASYQTLKADAFELVKARRHLEIRWGELLGPGEGVRTAPGRNASQASEVNASHAGEVLDKDERYRFRKLAKDRDVAIRYLNDATDSEMLSRAAVLTAVNRLKGGTGVVQSLTNEWYTPEKYLDAARLVVGAFDLDPASCHEANEKVKATRFFTEEDDGLAQDWRGRVWLNPPYGRLAGDFIVRLAEEYHRGHVTAAVTLVNAHCTDTQWFQVLWDHTLCFTDHRIDFAAGTNDRSGSTHGSVFAYLGPAPDAFAAAFKEFGAVLRRWP